MLTNTVIKIQKAQYEIISKFDIFRKIIESLIPISRNKKLFNKKIINFAEIMVINKSDFDSFIKSIQSVLDLLEVGKASMEQLKKP